MSDQLVIDALLKNYSDKELIAFISNGLVHTYMASTIYPLKDSSPEVIQAVKLNAIGQYIQILKSVNERMNGKKDKNVLL